MRTHAPAPAQCCRHWTRCASSTHHVLTPDCTPHAARCTLHSLESRIVRSASGAADGHVRRTARTPTVPHLSARRTSLSHADTLWCAIITSSPLSTSAA